MMIGVPVLALEQMEWCQPGHVLARAVLFFCAEVTDAVHRALRVQRPHQTDGTDPGGSSDGGLPICHDEPSETTERTHGQHQDLNFAPHAVTGFIKIRGVGVQVDRRGLPEPTQMRPPHALIGR